MKISLAFCFTERSGKCHNPPTPTPPPPKKKASQLKACGFSVVMAAKISITNERFVQWIIFFIPICPFCTIQKSIEACWRKLNKFYIGLLLNFTIMTM